MHNAALVVHSMVLDNPEAMPPPCYTATACAPAGQMGAMLTASPHNVRLSPSNRIGNYWFSCTERTFHLCVEYAPNGVADRYLYLDTWGGRILNDNQFGSTGVCT